MQFGSDVDLSYCEAHQSEHWWTSSVPDHVICEYCHEKVSLVFDSLHFDRVKGFISDISFLCHIRSDICEIKANREWLAPGDENTTMYVCGKCIPGTWKLGLLEYVGGE